jgi:hypothetical protein
LFLSLFWVILGLDSTPQFSPRIGRLSSLTFHLQHVGLFPLVLS